MIIFSFLRSLFVTPLFILWTVICSILTIFGALMHFSRSWVDTFIVWWGRGVLFLYNVKVREVGRENLIAGACVYIFSHSSYFDIFAMAACLPGMRFGAKIELFRIPFFGRAMRLAGVLPIARRNREKVLRVYEGAGRRTEQGHQFSLSPEGGRSENERLLPFKSGPFIFAISAQVPLVPVVIKGAHKVLPKNGILANWKQWKSEITLQYLPPISTEGVVLENRNQLQRLAYDQMARFFPGSEWKAN